MGADSRVKDLTGEILVPELETLLSSVYMMMDDNSFTDAEKILWKNMITSGVITDNLNDYQAMTPKAFYDSVMTGTAYGVGKIAQTSEVQSKSGTNVLVSSSQATMQSQWNIDWFQNTSKKAFNYDGQGLNYGAMAGNVALTRNFTQYAFFDMIPDLPSGKQIRELEYSFTLYNPNFTIPGTEFAQYSGVLTIGSGVPEVILNPEWRLTTNPDKNQLQLKYYGSTEALSAAVAGNINLIYSPLIS